jgi:hypothetical protein
VLSRAAPALGLAASVAFGIRQFLPDRLHAVTDIVGYPTHADFNINRYFYNYYMVAFVFPIAAVAFYLLIGRLTQERHAGTFVARPGHQKLVARAASSGFSSVAVVGTVLGLELGVSVGAARGALLGLMGATAVAYCGLVLVAARVSRHWRPAALAITQWHLVVNLVFANVTVLGLWAVSRSTGVRVTGGPFHRYGWFPFWLAAALTGAGVVVACRSLRAEESADLLKRAQRRIALGVVAPVGLTLLTARLPGALPVFDVFHDGEALVPSELVRHGLFPWKDFVFIHGFFNDILRSALGEHLFDHSLWGAQAGQQLLFTPLYWLVLWTFACWALRRHHLALISVAALIVAAGPEYVSLRILLWPGVLLALAATIHLPSWPRCAVLMGVLAAQVLATPESAYALVGVGATITIADLRCEADGWRKHFRRTARCAAAGGVVTIAWFGWLIIHGAAAEFPRQTLQFAGGHRLTGGIPITWGGSGFLAAAILPVAGIVVALWYVAGRLLASRQFSTDDWVLLAALLTLALYYPKFLARGDGHVYQPMALAFPLFVLLAARGLDYASARFERPRLAAIALVGTALAVTAPTIVPSVRALTDRYEPTVPELPRLAKVGYASPDALDWALVDDLRKVIDRYLRPGEAIFDFTNQPGIFHYLLDRRPATRYYHATLAIRDRAQRDAIAELERHPPRLVVYDNDHVGMYQWDGVTNMVRHYEISQYLLDHYRPAARLHGYILMVAPEAVTEFQAGLPHDLSEKPSFEGLGYGAQSCDWGYAPNFLRRPPPEAERAELPFTASEDGRLRIAVPAGLQLADYRWFELVARRGWSRADMQLTADGVAMPMTRLIRFRSIATRARTLSVRVGSCPAWHVFDATEIEITGTVPSGIEAVRLVR